MQASQVGYMSDTPIQTCVHALIISHACYTCLYQPTIWLSFFLFVILHTIFSYVLLLALLCPSTAPLHVFLCFFWHAFPPLWIPIYIYLFFLHRVLGTSVRQCCGSGSWTNVALEERSVCALAVHSAHGDQCATPPFLALLASRSHDRTWLGHCFCPVTMVINALRVPNVDAGPLPVHVSWC